MAALRERGPQTAGELGWVLWGTEEDRRFQGGGSHKANKFCRAAGAVLRRLERAGRAAGQFEGRQFRWRAL